MRLCNSSLSTLTVVASILFGTHLFSQEHSHGSTEQNVLKLSGKAMFSDEQLVREARLIVKSKSGTRYWQTGKNGEYSIDLRNAELEGVFVVAQKRIQGQDYSWSCEIVEPLKRTPDELSTLRFNNQGKVVARLLGANRIPKDFRVFVELRSRSERFLFDHKVRIRRELKHGESGIVFDDLEPREYRLLVTVPRFRVEPWTSKVIVADEAPYRAFVPCNLSSLQFGSLEASFVKPNGEPAALFDFWVEADSGAALAEKYRADLKGRIEVPFVPVGTTKVRAVEEGIAPVSVEFEIEQEKTTVLENCRLKADEEVFSWVEGKLSYQDRNLEMKPIQGTECHGFLNPSHGISSTQTSELGVEGEFKPDGSYRIKFPAGKRRLKIDIDGTGIRQRFQGGIWRPRTERTESYRSLILDLNTAPGEVVQRDITLRERDDPVVYQVKTHPITNLDELRLPIEIPKHQVVEPKTVYDSVWVKIGMDVSWVATDWRSIAPANEIPQGEAWFYTSPAAVNAGHGFSITKLSANKIELANPIASGQLEVEVPSEIWNHALVEDEEGNAYNKSRWASLELIRVEEDFETTVLGVNFPRQDLKETRALAFERGEDGICVSFKKLLAGNYLVKASDYERKSIKRELISKIVSVAEQGKTKVQIQLANTDDSVDEHVFAPNKKLNDEQ